MLARILPSLAALLGIALPAPAADVPRFNLVAIVTDDQAQWALGCSPFALRPPHLRDSGPEA